MKAIASIAAAAARGRNGPRAAALFARLGSTSEANAIQPVQIERLDMASGCGVAHVPDLSGRDGAHVANRRGDRRVDVPNAAPLDIVALRPMASLQSPSQGDRAKSGRKTKRRYRRKRGRKDRWLYGHIDTVLEASPHRVAPSCPIAEHCGGCTFQHVHYETQLIAKEEHLRNLLVKAAQDFGDFPWLLPPFVDVRPIIGCHDEPSDVWGYRNKMEFTFSPKEWLIKDRVETAKGQDHGVLGLHPSRKTNSTAARWHSKIVRVENCYLQPDACNSALNAIWEGVVRHQIPLYDQENYFGFMKAVIIRSSHNNAKKELFIDFRTGVPVQDEFDKLKALAKELTEHFQESGYSHVLAGITTSIDSQALRHEIRRRNSDDAQGQQADLVVNTYDGSPTILYGHSHFTETVQGLEFRVSYDSFFQPNPRQSERLFKEAASLLSLDGSQVLFDLFCGSGVVGLSLSAHGRVKSLFGFELNESAVEDAKYNAERNGMGHMATFKAVDLSEKTVAKSFDSLLIPDVVVVDPPRAGLSNKLIQAVARFDPDEICYISCNMETLVRDIVNFTEEGYFPMIIQPVDMLPHTNHLEGICILRKKDKLE